MSHKGLHSFLLGLVVAVVAYLLLFLLSLLTPMDNLPLPEDWDIDEYMGVYFTCWFCFAPVLAMVTGQIVAIAYYKRKDRPQ